MTHSCGSKALRKETERVHDTATKGDRCGSRHYERRQMWFTVPQKETDVVHGTTKRRQKGLTVLPKETDVVHGTTKGDRCGSRHGYKRG